MAFDNQSAGALSALTSILDKQFSAREADKNRGLSILQMKIQSDEREADRLNRQLMAMRDENSRYEQELVKLSGLQSVVDATGRGGGSAAVAKERQALSMDIEGMREQMAEAESRKEQLLGGLSTYYDAYNALAPEQFEKYVASGSDKTLSGISTIGDDEWGQIKSEYEKSTGKPLGKSQEAALRARFDDLGKSRFDQEYKERLLGLETWKLKMRQKEMDSAGSKQDFSYFDDLFQEKIDQYNQRINALQMRNKEYQVMGSSFIPTNVPRSVKSIVAAMNENQQNLAEWAAKFEGRSMSGELKDMISGYKKAKKSGNVDNMETYAAGIYATLRQNPEELTKGDFSDWPMYGGSADAPERFFGHDLIKAIDALQQASVHKLTKERLSNPNLDPAIISEMERMLDLQKAVELVDELEAQQTEQDEPSTGSSEVMEEYYRRGYNYPRY